jgi:hypothetical protein
MFDDIIEGECNGRNYYDSEPWNHEDDSNICPSESYKKKSNLWKTKDGKSLYISEMTDLHLINSIKYCENKGNYISAERLRTEQKRRNLKKELYKTINDYDNDVTICNFCKSTMKLTSMDHESHPNDGPGMGWHYTDYRLVCKCGAMGPILKHDGFKP